MSKSPADQINALISRYWTLGHSSLELAPDAARYIVSKLESDHKSIVDALTAEIGIEALHKIWREEHAKIWIRHQP